jgi:hypothetical protein
LLLAAGCGGGSAAATVPKPAPHSVRLPRFTHVVVVVFENHEASSIAGNPDAPTFNALAHRYATFTNYDAVAHPSLPNYLALVSGSTHGISSDCTDCVVRARSLADTLAAAGKSWKTYAEDLPYPGFTGGSSGRYAKKHDPFLYFRDVAGSRARRDRVVPFTRFGRDLARHRLPDFSLVIPNLCDDMHDCSVATGDAWLKAHVAPLLRSPELRGGVVFVVFDEGTSDTGGGGRIEALALGPTVRRGARFTRATNHYGLLRTILMLVGMFPHSMAPMLGRWLGKTRAVVIGGGLLGLEAAHGLSLRGMHVTVVHLLDTLMERQLDAPAGALLKAALEKRGIEFRMRAKTQEILGAARVTGVRTPSLPPARVPGPRQIPAAARQGEGTGTGSPGPAARTGRRPRWRRAA